MVSWANGVAVDYTLYANPLKYKSTNKNVSSFVDYHIYKTAKFFIKAEILTLLFIKRKSFRISEIIQHLKKVIDSMKGYYRTLYNQIKLDEDVGGFMQQLRKSNFIHHTLIQNGCDRYYLHKYKNNFDAFFQLDLFNNKRFVRYMEKNFQLLSMKTFINLNKILLCIKQHQPATIKDIDNFCKIYNTISLYNLRILPILKNTKIVIMKKISPTIYHYYINGDLL